MQILRCSTNRSLRSQSPYYPWSNGGQTLEYRGNDEIFTHPNYKDGVSYDSDYALMKLSSPITNIDPVAMDHNLHSPNYQEGKYYLLDFLKTGLYYRHI